MTGPEHYRKAERLLRDEYRTDRSVAEAQVHATLALAAKEPFEGFNFMERKFLKFALDLAAEQMASRGDEFDDGDRYALNSLRAMAGGAS